MIGKEGTQLGRKRQKVVRYTRSRLPKKYLCPNCGKNTVQVVVREDQEVARIICSNCSLRREVSILGETAPIDAYCKFVDQFYGVEEPQEQ